MSNSGREQLRMMGLNVTARDPTMDARTVHSVNVNNKKVRVAHGQMTRFIENAKDVSEHAFRQEEKELIRQIERLQRDKQSMHHITGHSSHHHHADDPDRLHTYAVRDDHNQPMYVTVTGRAEKDASKISVHTDGTHFHNDGTHFHNDASHHSVVQQPLGYGHTVKEWAHEMGVEQKSKKSFHGRHAPADRRISGSYIGARKDSTQHVSIHGRHDSSSHRIDAAAPASHRTIRHQTTKTDQLHDKKPSISTLSKTSRRPSEQSMTDQRRVSIGGTHIFDIGAKTSGKTQTAETSAPTNGKKSAHGHQKMTSEPLLSVDNDGKDKEKGKSRRSVPAQESKPSTKTAQQNERLSKSLHHVKTKQSSTESDGSKEPDHPPGEGTTRRRRGSVMTSKAENGNRNQSKLHQGLVVHPGQHLQLSHDALEEIHSLVDRGHGSFLPASLGTLSRKQQQRLLALQMQSQPSHQQEPVEFNAFETLQSRYLRLSDSNVETLIDICKDEGIDVGIHPHMDINDVGKIVFADENPVDK